jgi:hypothetical protein
MGSDLRCEGALPMVSPAAGPRLVQASMNLPRENVKSSSQKCDGKEGRATGTATIYLTAIFM